MQQYHCLTLALILMACLAGSPARGVPSLVHDGPDPVMHWVFHERNVSGTTLKARLGPNGEFPGPVRFAGDNLGQSAIFNGQSTECVLASDWNRVSEYLPKRELTISAVVAVDAPQQYGGIIGVVQDNGGSEAGWILGYNESVFTFALASEGANDGNGNMNYLAGSTRWEAGRLYHVVAVYDGVTMELYVNGKLEATSTAQSGAILYPKAAPFVIGSYRDDNEHHPLQGRIREISVYDRAAKAAWVEGEFAHHQPVTALERVEPDEPPRFVVRPFLQYGTRDSMTVVWQLNRSLPATLHWGETSDCENRIDSTAPAAIHNLRINNLQPETQYFYRVTSVGPAGADGTPGPVLESEVGTFQTASLPGTPIAFAVLGDTQERPQVSGPLAELAWAQRPNFLLLAGDLVDQGKQNEDWIDQFFPSMHPLISRVCLYPVLGNHEQNASNYFDYMALPDPEYYYSFSYGDADFFMIDSNRNVAPGSEQYQWLDEALGKSRALWKFVCHHHPPYSSDENDYGDLWKTNKSTRGDLRVRELVALYEKHHVDIVWTGHIHSYERTWPLRENRAVEEGGTIYMITGGGGGGLETPGPYRPFFQNNVRYGHHYTMVHLHQNVLELKAFSLDDRMFDTLRIEKDPAQEKSPGRRK